MVAHVEYRCDHCRARLNDRGVGEDHISLPIGPAAGRASQQSQFPTWRVVKRLEARRYHFCGPECLAEYMRIVLFTDEVAT